MSWRTMVTVAELTVARCLMIGSLISVPVIWSLIEDEALRGVWICGSIGVFSVGFIWRRSVRIRGEALKYRQAERDRDLQRVYNDIYQQFSAAQAEGVRAASSKSSDSTGSWKVIASTVAIGFSIYGGWAWAVPTVVICMAWIGWDKRHDGPFNTRSD